MQKVKNIGIITGVVLVVVIIAIIVIGVLTGSMVDVLYVALIIAALLTLAVTVLQILAIVDLIGTISTVRNEMKPLMASVQETAGVVKETVDVVKETAQTAGHTVGVISSAARLSSDYALAPTVRVVAMLMAAQQIVRVFLGRGKAGSRADQRRKQQMEAEAVAGGE
jgi:hypothetical protein